MLTTFSEISTEEMFVHHANASLPMDVTDSGIVSELNLSLKKASSPMVVSPEGNVTGGSFVHLRKASLSMTVTVEGILTFSRAVQSINRPAGMEVRLIPLANVAVANWLQPWKIYVPMVVTVDGMAMLVSAVQP